MRPPIIVARSAPDFLNLVPHLLGFQPERSVVLVAFRGNRTLGALRFNLPATEADDRMLRLVATTMIGTACRISGADALVPVIYTGERFIPQSARPHEAWARLVIARAEMSGFAVPDALCVAGNGWGSYLDPSCPSVGRPLDQIMAASLPAAENPGQRALATLLSAADLPRVTPAARQRVARAFTRLAGLAGAPGSGPELVPLRGAVLSAVQITEAALDWDPDALAAEDVAALLFLVQSPAIRDQVMLQVAFGRQTGLLASAVNSWYTALQRATGNSLDALLAVETDGGHPSAERRHVASPGQDVGDLVMGTSTRRPDAARIARATAVLKNVVALSPRSAQPAPLCILAWMSWAMGRSSVGGAFIDRALGIDAGYPMAGLLYTLLNSGHVPEWAFEPPPAQSGR